IVSKAKEDIPLPMHIKKGVEFKEVQFAYPNSEKDILKGINFTLKAGEKLAFVGQNGAGNTILIKLLLRFYEPTSAEILLDGVNINRYAIAEYQEFFGVIFQDFFRYEFTVRENIAIGDIDELENQDKIEEAAALSLAKEVVDDLKYGY